MKTLGGGANRALGGAVVGDVRRRVATFGDGAPTEDASPLDSATRLAVLGRGGRPMSGDRAHRASSWEMARGGGDTRASGGAAVRDGRQRREMVGAGTVPEDREVVRSRMVEKKGGLRNCMKKLGVKGMWIRYLSLDPLRQEDREIPLPISCDCKIVGIAFEPSRYRIKIVVIESGPRAHDGAHDESVDYLFAQCVFIKFIMVMGLEDVQKWELGDDVHAAWDRRKGRYGVLNWSIGLAELVAYWWTIWKARNNLFFRDIQFVPVLAVQRLKQLLSVWKDLL
uniref:Uncharacterized protein n=1 Tax=Ananas comosus var. bracteatus TaxID=296719 RepID=A0A6V7PHD1_ANACO|nr:unnamed protein product [Ananas comosus var. bracteatus]